jgi:hypothetical protein
MILVPSRPPTKLSAPAEGHVVRRVARPIGPVAGQVLGERAAAGDGEHVQAAADREERDASLEGGPHQRQLEPVPAMLGLVGLLEPLLVVDGRVQVPPAGEDQAVQGGDEGGHRVRRHRRQDHRRSPGPVHRADVANGREHGLPDPVPPAGSVKLAGDAYDRANHPVLLLAAMTRKASDRAPRSGQIPFFRTREVSAVTME